MKKAVLSSRIYISVDSQLEGKIRDELTYTIPSYNGIDDPITMRTYNVIRDGLMSIPIGRLDLIPEDYEIVDKRVLVPAEFPDFKFDLRESQQLVYDNLNDNAIINAKPSWGKAQPPYSKIRIPGGWSTIGEIQIGDLVCTPKGGVSKVVNKYNHYNKAIYEVTLKDGRVTHACGEHLWEIYRNRDTKTSLYTTEQLLEQERLLKEGRIYLPLTKPINDPENTHIIDPYLLGLLLGDGGITNSIVLSTADVEIIECLKEILPIDHSINHITNYDYRITSPAGKPNAITEELRRLGLYGHRSWEKFIPSEYLYDSEINKIKLLQGLLDSDGSIETSGKIEFCTTSKKLMDGFVETIRSLGGAATVSSRLTEFTYKDEKKQGRVSYRCRPTKLTWRIKSQLFKLHRKRTRIKPGKLDEVQKIAIESIVKIEPSDCQCIELDSEDKLYLTDDYIVTHNTFAGLAIAGKLAQKTLVVVHTVPLRSQWANEVNKVYGIEPGIIGSGKFNIDSPIVIGNVQSLYNCVPLIQKEFGTVILDEMHHVSSPTFSRVIDKNLARFKIGLSGTLQRKDGKHAVFRDYFSNNVFTPPPENSMTPEVHVYRIGMHIPPGKGWALRINELMSDPAYVKTILNIADKYKGRKILAVADRVDFLQFCASRREKAVAVVGSTQNREELIKSVEYENDEIWGTISIFKEGISQNNLSTLILGAPINNDPMLEQLVGRIQRITPNKPTPIVVDICFDGFTGISQFNKRLEFYTRMGYNVKYI